MNKRYVCVLLLMIILTGCTHSMHSEISETAHNGELKTDLSETEMDTIPQEMAQMENVETESDATDTAMDPENVLQTLFINIDTFGDMVPVGDGESFDFVQDEQYKTYICKMDLAIPSIWQQNGSVALDKKRAEAEIFSTKRMEYCTFLYKTSDVPETAAVRTTNAGETYYTWDETSATQDGYGVIYTHAVYPISDTNELIDETLYFHIYFLTYSDDQAGYYEEVIMPIVNGVEYVFVELKENTALQ